MHTKCHPFFPARVTGLRARKNGTISLEPDEPLEPDDPVARRRIDANPSWIRKNK